MDEKLTGVINFPVESEISERKPLRDRIFQSEPLEFKTSESKEFESSDFKNDVFKSGGFRESGRVLTSLRMYSLEGESLKRLNSLTKYPSILTYHETASKGTLGSKLVEGRGFAGEKAYVTEKVNGTNVRIVLFTDGNGHVRDYLIGSREELIYARGDRLPNPTLGIVEIVGPIAETLVETVNTEVNLTPDSVICLYGEAYGGSILGSKEYTRTGQFGFRLFDMWQLYETEALEKLSLPIDKISSWREHGGQPYEEVSSLQWTAALLELPMVPYITILEDGAEIGSTLTEVYAWLQQFQKSEAGLDENYSGKAEGVVVRTQDRSLIRKIRFEDYERTERVRGLE